MQGLMCVPKYMGEVKNRKGTNRSTHSLAVKTKFNRFLFAIDSSQMYIVSLIYIIWEVFASVKRKKSKNIKD